MKKRVIFILTFVLALPFLLTGCGTSTNMSNFSRDYNAHISSNVKLERVATAGTTGKTTNALEHFTIKKNATLTTACNNVVEYRYIVELYDPLVFNALSATHYFAPDMATRKYSESVADNCYTAMKKLFTALDAVVDKVNDLERSLSMETDATHPVNLAHLKQVYKAYEGLIVRSINLSQTIISSVGYSMSSKLLDYSYTNGATQSVLHTSLVSENYLLRYKIARDYYYFNIYDNSIPAKIIGGTNGFSSLAVLNTFVMQSLYQSVNAGINGTTSFNASKTETNAITIRKQISNYLASGEIYKINSKAFNEAFDTISYNLANQSNNLSYKQSVSLLGMQTYLRTSQDYYSLLQGIIDLCK